MINSFHALKRRFFRTLDLSAIPGLRLVRQTLIEKTRRPQVRVLHGATLFLDPQDSLGLSWHKAFEPMETKFFSTHIQPGQTVVDIGANIGYFTTLFSKKVGPKGSVIAFEPDRDNFALLKKNVELNNCSNVELVNSAVSDKDGSLRLFVSSENAGDHRSYDSGDGRPSYNVPCVRLDTFLNCRNKPISFIKMDIQGAEFAALNGMQETLNKNHGLTLVTEFQPNSLEDFGVSGQAVLDLLLSFGFILEEIQEKEQTIQPVRPDELLRRFIPESPHFTNLICRR